MKAETFGADENELIGSIYEAALDPTHWRHVLLHLRDITDAKDCNLIFYDMLNRQRNDLLTSTVTDKVRNEYLSTYIDTDMKWAKQLARGIDDSGLACSTQISEIIGSSRELVQDNSLREWYESTLNYGDQAACFLLNKNYSIALVSVNRPLGLPSFEPKILELLRRLNPHFQRSIRIHHQLTSARDNYRKLQATLEKTAAGLLLLDADGSVTFANQEGARTLEQHLALKIGHGGRLQAATSQDDQNLQQLIQNTNAARERIISLNESRISIPLYHEKLRHPLKVTVLPLKDSGLDFTLMPEKITSVVFVADPERTWAISPEYLQQAYGLTRSECEVSQAIANGNQVSEIAAQRGTAQETVRWQIKEVLQKTNTHSQVELLRLLITLSADFVTPVA